MDELNPIIKREVRARWRKWSAFAVIFGYAVLFSSAAIWTYYHTADDVGRAVLDTSTANLGRELFQKINLIQLIGWILLAPVLNAPLIAGEREKGLLEGVQLTHLTPKSIVWGKLGGSLSFIALMLLVPLPAAAVCFQMGGVSPLEFCEAFVLNVVTAITCAAIGINCSAHNGQIPQAIISSLVGAGIYTAIPGLSPLFANSLLFASTNTFGPLISIGLAINLGLQLALTWALIQGAARVVLKPLTAWEPPPPSVNIPLGRSQVPLVVTMTPQPLPKEEPTDWEKEYDPAQFKRWDMPLAHLLQFDNPILQREVRIRLRLRQKAVVAPQGGAGALWVLGLFFMFYAFLIMVGERNLQFFYWAFFSWIWLVAIITACAVLGAIAFTREREANMLEPLMLTSLTTWEILWGKVSAPLVVVAYYSITLLPVLLPCLIHLENGSPAFGVPFWIALATLFIVMCSAWFATTLGAFISWYSRFTLIALATTIGLILIALLILPGFCTPTSGSQSSDPLFWHPFLAFAKIFGDKVEFQSAGIDAFTGAVVVGILACLWLGLLAFAMRHGPREKDRAKRNTL